MTGAVRDSSRASSTAVISPVASKPRVAVATAAPARGVDRPSPTARPTLSCAKCAAAMPM